GKGRYTDDINRPGQAYLTFLYSPHARAKINGIDTSKAKAAPGVLAVYVAADIAADGVGGPICGWTVTQKNGEPHKSPAVGALASDRVNHVGENVAAVVAQTLAQAKDAAELIEVDYEPQTPLMKMTDALAGGAAQLHDDVPGNLCYDWEIGDTAATEAAFAGAHHVGFTKDWKYGFVQNAFLNLKGMDDGSIKVVDLETEKVVASVDTLKNMGFNPNCIVLLPRWNHLAGH
ncbi:MAG: hypothetical protein V3T76_03355, partial [candidate division NC10 bacterium]